MSKRRKQRGLAQKEQRLIGVAIVFACALIGLFVYFERGGF